MTETWKAWNNIPKLKIKYEETENTDKVTDS